MLLAVFVCCDHGFNATLLSRHVDRYMVVYKKFDGYVPRSEPSDGFAGGKVVHVDKVEWIYIPDTNTATQALIAGEVDAYEIPPIDLLPVLEADPNITVKVLDKLGKMGHIRPNHRHFPFNNVKARQALQLLVDQTSFLAAQVGNPSLEKVCYSVFMCDSPFSTSDHAEPWMKQDKVDPQLACSQDFRHKRLF